MKEQEVQVRIGDDQIQVVANPKSVFRIVKALRADGHNLQVRYKDNELRDWTCWQSTSKAA